MPGKKITVKPSESRFYYTVDSPHNQYSHTPSHEINISRMLSGLPAFKNMGTSKIPNKKILILNKIRTSVLSPKQRLFRQIRLDWLNICGFTIHADDKNDVETLIEQYQCTASALYYFNEDDHEAHLSHH